MKKFSLGICVAVAAALTACGPRNGATATNDTRICTDGNGNRVSDYQCNGNGWGGGGYYPYHWFFIRNGGYYPYIGQHIYNDGYGSSRPYSGVGSSFHSAPSAAPSGISRGGFGSSGRSFGGFGE